MNIMAKSKADRPLKVKKVHRNIDLKMTKEQSPKLKQKSHSPEVAKLQKVFKDKNVKSPRILNADSTEQFVEKSFNFVSAPKDLVSAKQIQSGVSALFQYVEKTANTQTALFEDEKPVFLQITSIKVPKVPARILRLPVPHAITTDSNEICLIVQDIGQRKDHDETVEHFEQLLNEHGITNIKTILPFHQFKTEYANQFELKRNLLGLYDTFLVDSKVAGYVSKLLGKIFMEKRKMPAPVKLHVPKLKTHIEKTLRKTSLKIHSNSDSFIVQVGNNKMEHVHISENVEKIIEHLYSQFPGGTGNIRALSIKMDKGIAVPIYLTLQHKNQIPVPVIHSKRPKHFEGVREELSTRLNKQVTVLPSGKVFVHTVGSEDEDNVDDELETL